MLYVPFNRRDMSYLVSSEPATSPIRASVQPEPGVTKGPRFANLVTRDPYWLAINSSSSTS